MGFACSNKAGFTVLEGDDELTIFTVGECYESCRTALQGESDSVLVDLTKIQDFDSAGLQLLLWCKRQAEQADKTFRVTHDDNDIVQQQLDYYQLGDDLCAQSSSDGQE